MITDTQILAVSESSTDRETVIRMIKFAIGHGIVKTSDQLREVSDMALGIAKIDGLDRPTPASYGEALQYETIQGLLACGMFNEYANVRKRAVRVLDAARPLELGRYIGKQGLLLSDKLRFAVFVQDCKLAYGNVRFQVTPVSGTGMVWVDSSRVQFTEEEHGQ